MPPKKPGNITRSEASRQQLHIESLGSVGSPPTKASRRARQKVKKQASKSANSPKKQVNLPGSESAITSSIVVIETKKKESQVKPSSEDKESSTRSEGSKKEESQSLTCSKELKKDEGS